MTLLAGDELDEAKFFCGGMPVKRASSFDLTVGSIFNDKGMKVGGPYILQPNEMVQVTSAEAFNLPSDVTAHVSYKTGLTHKGIWALTVGVVDPGWNCPVSTTLFNFSKVPFAINEGDVFLRVSLFKHSPVPEDDLHQGPTVGDYTKRVQATAGTTFGRHFLNTEKVAEDAGKLATKQMQDSALKWVAGVAFLFAVLQLAVSWLAPAAVNGWHTTAVLRQELSELREQIAALSDARSREHASATDLSGAQSEAVRMPDVSEEEPAD